MAIQLAWEDVISDVQNWKGRSRWPEVLRHPPVFVGPPTSLPSRLSPHTLAIAIPVRRKIDLEAVTADMIVNEVWGYLHQLAIVATPEFLRDWVLFLGTPEMFAAQGMMLTKPDRACITVRPAILAANLIMPDRKTKVGAQAYGDMEQLAHKLVGAQLFRLDRMLQGAINKLCGGRRGAPPARSSLSINLEPFLRLTRGADSPHVREKTYDRLIKLGKGFLAELYGSGIENPTGELAMKWKAQGFGLESRAHIADDLLHLTPVLMHELKLLNTCLQIADRAHQIETEGHRPLRFHAMYSGSRPAADLDVSTQNALLGQTGEEFVTPLVIELTELAFRFRINPSVFYPILNGLDVHFVCAELIGDASRGVLLPAVPNWRYWGLKGLVRSVHDNWLCRDLQVSRSWLRDKLTTHLLDLSELPGAYALEEQSVKWPIWNYRSSIRR